jgi:hypothetical protein
MQAGANVDPCGSIRVTASALPESRRRRDGRRLIPRPRLWARAVCPKGVLSATCKAALKAEDIFSPEYCRLTADYGEAWHQIDVTAQPSTRVGLSYSLVSRTLKRNFDKL